MNSTTVALLGFGEVGQILADDLSSVAGVVLRAYDTQFNTDSAPARAIRARPWISRAETAAELVPGSDVVISAVTAAEDVAATGSIAPDLDEGTWVLDLNSVAPATKRVCATTVETARGRYVEGVVMAPIAPGRIRSPILLGGPHAGSFLSRVVELGFTGARLFSNEIGPASATKMCRSVIIKGLEALVTESLLAARHYGVDRDVLDSLADLPSARDWPRYADYLIGRSIEHGVRRAEEMREVAATVAAAGIEPLMSDATAARQEWAAQFPAVLAEKELGPRLDAIRGELAC